MVEYVAEFWSTITNLVLIFTGIWGIYETRKQGFELRYHKWIRIRQYEQNLKVRCYIVIVKCCMIIFRYQLIFCSLLAVGVGSWLFHMTLKYEMQLLDELPMIWGG